MKRTISAMVEKGSLNHNSREFYASNVDPSRSYLNIEFCREDIRDVYHELFDDAQERFNAKQTRNDRRIENYYGKICSSKQEKPFHEIVLQIGNKDDTGIHTELAETAKQCLTEYAKGFQARNPTLRVFWSHLHMDEATPHLHIDLYHRQQTQHGYARVTQAGACTAWFQGWYTQRYRVESVGAE